MKHISLLVGLLAFFAPSWGTVFQIPPGIQNGSSTAQFTSSASGIDAPKVSPINASSSDCGTSTSAQPALPGASAPDSVLRVVISVTFPNGTLWSATANGEQNATVTSDGDNTTGIWHGTGFSWVGSKAGYVITIDAPEVGVTGTITFAAVAPAHYPCGPAVAGQNMEIGPQIGWANAVPDAASIVDLSIYGASSPSRASATTTRCNWSPVPFATSLASWYWGHGRIGPYSLVWFDFLDTSGIEHVSAFLFENGAILGASCAPGDPGPGTLEIDVSVRLQTIDANSEYARFIGNLSASTGLTGVALFEQIKVTA
ncbi:hypothetical protein B0H11DRAFT_2257159 [Mycena galericulata]|nr:hypothetical protein B0H11DRAFT_2257159 [Mycena galericulata]